MQRFRVLNLSKGGAILEEAELCGTFGRRLKGLLGRKLLPPGKGIIIRPCRSVHTVGMAFPIDVAFVDRKNGICRMVENLKPNKLSLGVKNACFVIEAPAGTLSLTQTAVGDRIKLEEI